MSRYQGDVKLFLTEDGADINMRGGQPEMDGGWNNTALLSLFASDWVGNVFFRDAQKLKSDFVEKAQGPLTLSKLVDIEQAAARCMKSTAFGTVGIEVSNPRSVEIETKITVTPPSGEPEEILTTRNGLNWIAQGAER